MVNLYWSVLSVERMYSVYLSVDCAVPLRAAKVFKFVHEDL